MYITTKRKKKLRSYSDLTVLNYGQSIFQEKKLLNKTKTSSIANLENYFKSNINTNDKLVSSADAMVKPFRTKAKASFGTYSIIEEENEDIS